MTNEARTIGGLTLLLSMVAGYCDTATFVAGAGIFSAHVTGNFIVFAAQAVLGTEPDAWIKLLTFPVFIVAIITGGWIIERSGRKYRILHYQGCMLLLAGGTAWGMELLKESAPGDVYVLVMMVVFAMGFQNAFGKKYAQATHGPTTMMTGNVTQLSLDTGLLLRTRFKALTALAGIKKQLVGIAGFLTGCLLGALGGSTLGLPCLILPGAAMLLYCLPKGKDIISEPARA